MNELTLLFYMFLIFLLLNSYIIESSILNNNPIKGNALDVFLKYVEITSNFSSNEIFGLWNDCVNKVSINFRAMPCSNDVRNKLINIYSIQYPISLHDNRIRIIDPSYSNKLLPDCKYHVSFINEENIIPIVYLSEHLESNILSFNIIETTCNSYLTFNDTLPKGGSSFEVLAWSEHHQIACNVFDFFNSTYSVTCDTLHYNSIYYNISIILDYEHYDAYSDIYGTFMPMNKIIFKGMIKLEGIIHDRQRKQRGNWERIPRRNFPFHDYRWTGLGNTFIPSKLQFQELFGSNNNEETYLIGDSHIRYNWDYYYYLYYGANKLAEMDRKHGYSAHIPGIIHQEIFFATDIGDSIMNQQCPTGSLQKRNYVFHTGHWDLRITPARNFILNGNAGPHLVDGIKVLITKNCSIDSIRLIFIATMPYPRCHSDIECDQSRGYRNNYAISAVNEYLSLSIQNLMIEMSENYNKFNIYTIDTNSIIKPRLGTYERAGNHFLFHPSGDILETTSGGIAVAGEILHLLLDLSIHPSAHNIRNQKLFLTRNSNMSNISPFLTLSTLSTKFHHFRSNIQKKDFFQELALIADCKELSNCSSIYLFESGIVRLIDDADTFLQSYLFLSHFLHTSSIDDIPLHTISIPSRRNTSIYVGAYSKETFNIIINGHLKRIDSKEDTMEYLKINNIENKDLNNVNIVSERDLLDIGNSP